MPFSTYNYFRDSAIPQSLDLQFQSKYFSSLSGESPKYVNFTVINSLRICIKTWSNLYLGFTQYDKNRNHRYLIFCIYLILKLYQIIPLVNVGGGVGISSRGKLCFGHRPAETLDVPLVTSVPYLQLGSVILMSYCPVWNLLSTSIRGWIEK